MLKNSEPDKARHSGYCVAASAVVERLEGENAEHFWRPLLGDGSAVDMKCVACLLLAAPPTKKVLARLTAPLFVRAALGRSMAIEVDEWARVCLVFLVECKKGEEVRSKLALNLIRIAGESEDPEAASRLVSTLVLNAGAEGLDAARIFPTLLCLHLHSVSPGPLVKNSEASDCVSAAHMCSAMLEDQSGLEALFRDAVAIFKVLRCIFVFGVGGGYGEGMEAIDFDEGTGGGPKIGAQEGQEADPAPLLSIALGILTAILELGEEKRDEDEEEALQSLAPALVRLAEEYYDVEVKEMAGHAVAMIGARRADTVDGEKKAETVGEMLDQVEEDLKSRSPPIRAKAVANLTKLARTAVKANDDMISVVGEEPGDDPRKLVPRDRVLGLILEGLQDEESYVYLGAVAALTALTDCDVNFGLLAMTDVVASRKTDPMMRTKVGEAFGMALRR